MLQRQLDPATDPAQLVLDAGNLLTVTERVDLADPAPTVERAVHLFRSVWREPELAALLTRGTSHFEVPFSWFDAAGPGTCLRGAVDCLVRLPEGEVVVLEFKTGRPRPEHQQQLDLYVRAMTAVFAGAAVRGRVCYPELV
jgi:RecB family exonuclease